MVTEWWKEKRMPKEFNVTNNLKHEGVIVYLNAIKVFAAFMIVFYHFAYYRIDYGFIQDSLYLPNLNRLLMSFCACSVPLFFMVNGALMFRKERTIKYFVFRIIKIVVILVVWGWTKFPNWFFITLMGLYIIAPVLQVINSHSKAIWRLIQVALFVYPFGYNMLLLMLKVCGVNYFFGFSITKLTVTGMFTIYSVLYFMIGADLNKVRLNKPLSILLMVMGYLIVITECVVYTNINNSMYDGVNHAFPTIGAFLLSLGVWGICSNLQFTNTSQMISRLQTCLLPVYVFHSILIRISESLLPLSEINTITAFIGTLFIFAGACIIGEGINHIPVVKWSMKI